VAKTTTPKHDLQATGRRKGSVARIRLRRGAGKVTINKRNIEDYFPSMAMRTSVTEPMRIVNAANDFDVDVTMGGGGISGQAGALRLALARALARELGDDARVNLKKHGLLTRDPREKESKKYGLKKARKAPQYSKR
jgi:small subunit ribosomal protein S9